MLEYAYILPSLAQSAASTRQLGARSIMGVAKELESLQPQQIEAISKLLEQVLSADDATIHDTVCQHSGSRHAHITPRTHMHAHITPTPPTHTHRRTSWQVLMRALSADAPSIRGTGLKAGVLMVRGPGSSKAVELMAVFDALLDKASGPAHFEYGILSLYGELGRNLGSAPLEKLLNRLDGQLSSESESVGKGAARGLASALGGALESGMVELEDVQLRAQAGLDTAAAANTAAEARAAAFRIGAACAAAGAERLQEWGVVTKLFELVAGESAATEYSREAALLAIDQLCLRLRARFEPYLLPQLEDKVIAMYADKDRKVVDAAAKVVKTLVTGLNPLAVKLVLPALYRGMEVTCAWRTKEACIQALGLLAQHAKVETGPCLQVHRSRDTLATLSQQTLSQQTL